MPENENIGSAGDTVTEVSSQSWLSRLAGSLMGVLFGLALVPGAGIGLWWNEGRAVQTSKSLAEGAGAVIAVAADRLDAGHQGKLVHVSGALRVSGPLRDAEFGVAIEALRLVRRVEMYQWKEEKHEETRNKLGGGQETVTTYKYIKTWSDEPIDSARFREPRGHGNPPMIRRSLETTQDSAQLGAFAVPQTLLLQIDAADRLEIDAALVQRIGAVLRRPAQIVDGSIYVGSDPAAPQIGDLRVGFSYARVQPVSVIAAQDGNALIPYQTRAGDRLHLIAAGSVAAAQMFADAEQANTILTWILRGVGGLAMFMGFALIMRPLSVLASVLPFLGDVVGAGTGLIAMLLTVIVAPLVIAMAWLFYRPLIGVAILLVGGALTFAVLRLVRRRAALRAPAAPAGAATGPVMR